MKAASINVQCRCAWCPCAVCTVLFLQAGHLPAQLQDMYTRNLIVQNVCAAYYVLLADMVSEADKALDI